MCNHRRVISRGHLAPLVIGIALVAVYITCDLPVPDCYCSLGWSSALMATAQTISVNALPPIDRYRPRPRLVS